MLPVVVYSKKPCVQCSATYRWLKKKGFEEGRDYEIRNLPDWPDELAAFKELGMLEAPVVVIEGRKPFSGFNPTLLEEYLAPKAQAGSDV